MTAQVTHMARGWESKAVADQIEAGKESSPPQEVRVATKRDAERRTRLESLRLSKSRLLQQLESAKHPAHREVLLRGLRAVEEEIEAVSRDLSNEKDLK
jgi:hypothetical protein